MTPTGRVLFGSQAPPPRAAFGIRMTILVSDQLTEGVKGHDTAVNSHR